MSESDASFSLGENYNCGFIYNSLNCEDIVASTLKEF